MATTSTQNYSSYFPSSSSSSSQYLWHVFLSFHGEDTRKTFTGNLYAALGHAGIRTFLDNHEIRRGEELSPNLIQAIRDSKASIVVFSENYASSKWCLNELVEIMDCKRTKGQVVFPIFFNVNPAVVRHQIGSFEKAFQKHEKRYMDRIDIWKSSLVDAAELRGYDLKNDANGHEAELIQEIVEAVQQSVCFQYPLKVAEHPVGIDSRINAIKPKLGIGSNDVRFFGIHGMGGIGKTTIARYIYNEFYKDFEGRCFLKNVGANSQPPDIVRLQEQLIYDVLKTNNTLRIRDVDEGASFIQETFWCKRVLIILDDLNHSSQLKSLAGHPSWFGRGSRIIITTRDSRLLDEFQIDVQYVMEKLTDDESLELFSYHAFKRTTPFQDFMDLSRRVVSYTDGLPLALEILGSSLFRRTEAEWTSTLEKLQKIPNSEIQKILRISYDALDDDKQKEIFLDIAFFFIGMDKEEVIDILDACDSFPASGIPILRERCLLKIDWGNKLRMHDLIQHMGKEIVREESFKHPGKRSRLCCEKEVFDVLKKHRGSKSVEGITLDLTTSMSKDFDAKTFESMPNLRLLRINNVRVTGNFEISFAELRWLCWQRCPLTCLPSTFNPSKLISLDLQYSNLSTLWEGTKDLQSLKILNVSHSECLTTTPDFGGVKKLKKLILEGCTSLSRVHLSIGQLTSMIDLDFSGCLKLKRLPEQLGDLQCLKKLDASDTAIEELPDSIGLLGMLVELGLGNCERLKSISGSICNLTSLEILDLNWCVSLERLPDSIGSLNKLQVLCLSHCDLEYLPNSIGHLDSLVDWRFSFFKRLKSLPSSICNITSLKKLYLIRCQDLEYLPDSIGHLNVVHTLNLNGCEKLKNLPNSICNLTSLETLNLNRCRDLEYLSDSIGHLNGLHKLNLSGCENIKNLPNNICNLTSLEKLNLDGCWDLEYLPDSIGNLDKLNSLGLEGCEKLKSLPNSICNLTSVKTLSLQGCCDLKFLPDQLGNMEGLVELSVAGKAVEQLPGSLKYLNKLQILDIQSSRIENIPEWIGTCLSSLKKLNIRGKNIRSLPSTLAQLSKLHSLSLVDCINLQSLPPHLPSSLHHLNLKGCISLLELPKLSHLKDLFTLHVTNCSSLQVVPSLPPGVGNLCAGGCTSLQKLPKLPNMLLHLDLWNCNKLEFTLEKSFIEAHHFFQSRLPDKEVPNWFSYQNMGSTVSVDLPQNLENNFRGLCTWVVYVSTSKSFPRIQVVIINKTEGAESHFGTEKRMAFEEQSYVTSTDKRIAMKSGDRIEVSFAAMIVDCKGEWVRDGDVKITRCGVHLLYNHPNVSNNDYRKRIRNDDFAELTAHSKRFKYC